MVPRLHFLMRNHNSCCVDGTRTLALSLRMASPKRCLKTEPKTPWLQEVSQRRLLQGPLVAKGFSFCSIPHLPSLLQGIGTDEKCLIEILASRTNEQMHQLVAAYKDGEMGRKDTQIARVGTLRLPIPLPSAYPPL